jgi:hypothetical protein
MRNRRIVILFLAFYAVATLPSRLAGVEKGVHQAVDQLAVSAWAASQAGSAPRAGIRGVDFRNFDYPSDCWKNMGNSFSKIIHASKGAWKKQQEGETDFFSVEAVAYDNGQDEAAVHTVCTGGTNFGYNEVFVYTTSPGGPKLLGKLSPSDWGAGEEDNGRQYQVSGVQFDKQGLAISFYAGGSHACPAWLDTARFRWNSTRFVRTTLDRKPFNCQAK